MWSRIRSRLVRRDRIEHDMADEVNFHLAARAEDLVRCGVSRAEASRGATWSSAP